MLPLETLRKEASAKGVIVPPRSTRAVVHRLLAEASLSPIATEKERAAKATAEQNAPDLCAAFRIVGRNKVSLGDIISCIPMQGQKFGGANEWKPWCRLVEELRMVADNVEAEQELQFLQSGRPARVSIHVGGKFDRTEYFFTFYPLLSYLLALLSPTTRIMMLATNYLVPFSDSAKLPRGHPARLELDRAELHTLLLYTESEEASKLLFLLSSASSLLDISPIARRKLIEQSLQSAVASFRHKKEMVRLIYESGLHNEEDYRKAVNMNVISHLLDKAHQRRFPGFVVEDQKESTKELAPFIYDLGIAFNPEIVHFVTNERVASPEDPQWSFLMQILFPVDQLTSELYADVVEAFLYHNTGILVARDEFFLFQVINKIASLSPSRAAAYIRDRLLPAYCDRSNELYTNAVYQMQVSTLELFATQLSIDGRTQLLDTFLRNKLYGNNLMIVVPKLVALGADLSAVDIHVTSRGTSEFLRYFLQTRDIISVNALISSLFILRTEEIVPYLSSPALTRVDKLRIAKVAYKTLRISVLRKLEADIGLVRPLPRIVLLYIRPYRLVALVKYLGDDVASLWNTTEDRKLELRNKLLQLSENPICSDAVQKVLSYYRD